MSATITLPSLLRTRLAALQRRIRLLRVVRGFAWLVIVLALSAAAALFADYWLDLPASARQIFFGVWLAEGVGLLLLGMAVPLGRRIDAPALAAVIEEKYPDLGERLTSAVALADAADEGHGSPLLIALLLQETAERSAHLDFRPAVSACRAGILAAVAVIVALLIAAPAFVRPGQYGDLTQRFFRPWDIAPAAEAVSDSYCLTAIAPVELAAESPRITVTPPAYARSVKEEETFHGLVDLSPLQHSEIRFDFRFTRPAATAYLEEWRVTSGEWREKTTRHSPLVTRHSLNLSADRQEATLTIPAIKEGQYRLVLEAEHAVRTELPGGTIRVQPDQPPSVVRFVGKEELRSVLPYERIPLEIEAADDIGVASVELEYRINNGEVVRHPLDLQGGNATSVVARHVVELAGKVKEDDRFSYRFRVRDNLPKQYEGPHVIVYPPDRWRTLRIARRGDPFQQRDIVAQRDDINRQLQAIREALIQQGRGVFKVGQETRLRPSLSPDKLQRVKQLHDENRASQQALRDVAEVADAAPALQAIAEQARDVADREMATSQQALEQAARQAAAERNHQFEIADEQLDSAVKRLEELRKTNDQLAQERLDRAKLETLADREKRLVELAAELAAKHPVLDPKARELAEKIKREQAEVSQELERLAQQSEPLKQGLEQACQEQSRKMAERARALAQAQRDLARAETETEWQRQTDRLAELVRRRRELAEQARKMHSLPNKDQSEKDRQLARQQRELRDALQRAAQTARGERPVVRDNPIEELAQKQAELAQQTAALAQNIGREQGEKTAAARQAEQARQAARQAIQHMRAGALPQARQAGQQSAERLRQLAARLARPPRGDDAQASDPLRKTRQLEKRQEEINRRLQPLADDTRAQAAQQHNQQRHLQQETGEMMRQFQRLVQQSRTSAPMQSAMQRAKDASQQAQQAMRQAREQAQRGESAAEKQSQERAAQELDRAAQAASEPRPSESGASNRSLTVAAPQEEPRPLGSGNPPLPNGRGSESRSKVGETVARAGQQMAVAQGQLQQGQSARAQSAMKQAAQSLAQAAQQMSLNSASLRRQQRMPDQSLGLGRLPGGLPDLSAYGLDKTTHAGKSWGELPGELRTKIVQDMKTRYGDDYARMIKDYFEYIADTKKK